MIISLLAVIGPLLRYSISLPLLRNRISLSQSILEILSDLKIVFCIAANDNVHCQLCNSVRNIISRPKHTRELCAEASTWTGQRRHSVADSGWRQGGSVYSILYS